MDHFLLTGYQVDHNNLIIALNIEHIAGIVFFTVADIILQRLNRSTIHQICIFAIFTKFLCHDDCLFLTSVIIKDQCVLTSIGNTDMLSGQCIHQLVNYDRKSNRW